jgi:hypothetical protein
VRARKHAAVAGLAAALALAAAAPAGAAEAGGKVAIHGYGNWAYGKTDGNAYQNGNDEGNYDELEFSLQVAAEPSPKVGVHAQIFVEREEGGSEASVDFAFAEYAFDDALRLRIGAVKQPFGIFTEIFDVGTVYPFVNLAQGIYGPAGTVSESYLGLGLTGRVVAGGGWGVQYDLYGGEMESAFTAPWGAVEGEAEGAVEGDEEGATDVQDMVGGRVTLTTPGQSLTCGLSAYTGTEDTESFGEESGDHRHTAFGAQAEYFVGPAVLRAEFARVEAEEFSSNAAYAEAAWRISSHWQLAARYDWARTELDEDDGVGDALLEHDDLGFAVNYFFSPNMVLKLAVHQVTGNRFTTVDDEDEEQDEKTVLVAAGVSFSF